MNILVLNYEYPPIGGGAASVSRDIAVRLADAGHRVRVVTMGFGSLPAYETDCGTEVYRIPCIRKKQSSCAPWEQLSYLISLRHFIKTHPELCDADVCHCHFFLPTGAAALWLRKKYGIPYVITAHGSDVPGHNQKLQVRMLHAVLKNSWRRIAAGASEIAAPSRHLIGLIERAGAARCKLIPNGVEVSDGAVPDSEKDKVILMMGRMQRSKGFQTALKALARVKLNGWRVEIAGDGPYRPALEELARVLEMESSVDFRGWIAHGSREHGELLRKAAVYISASEYENCPVTVLEAAAAGCRVLLSDISAHRDMMGDQAMYFPVGDEGALARLLGECLVQDVRALRYDLKAYAWPSVIAEYEALYRVALLSRASGE